MVDHYKNKKVLVTGGAGFIGSHVTEALVQLGAQVTTIDDLSSGSLDNIASISKNITIIVGSVCDYALCLRATHGQHYVFHLAARVSVPESMTNPRGCHETNVTGTFNMLEAARIHNVSAFVFSSSSSVYGNINKPATESMLCQPMSPYGYTKHLGELYCKQYASLFGMNTIIARYFNVHGHRQNPYGPYASVVATFRHNMLTNNPITIFGDGNQQRDFVSVKDIVRANLLFALLPPQYRGEIFNVGSGKSMTLRELFSLLKSEYPTYPHKPTFAPARAGDTCYSQANIKKYQNLCNSFPHLSYTHP